MSLEETIQAIVHDHKSIARFGDGEFGLMFGDARWRFQRTDEKLPVDKTILIALGPTASVLAYDLALMGYHAIDIGHVDLSYEWLIRNNGAKTAVTTKYNNEYPEGYIVEDIHDSVYDSQIIANVNC